MNKLDEIDQFLIDKLGGIKPRELKDKINQVYLSASTSSGTRYCFYCNQLITDRTLLVENFPDDFHKFTSQLTFHIPCFKSFLEDLNRESSRF